MSFGNSDIVDAELPSPPHHSRLASWKRDQTSILQFCNFAVAEKMMHNKASTFSVLCKSKIYLFWDRVDEQPGEEHEI